MVIPITFALIPGLPQATGWVGTLWSIVGSILLFFIYAVPLLLLAGIGIGAFFWLRYKKRFDIDVIIKVIANNNIVVQHDRGGVFKNLVGAHEFRLMKSRISMPIPDRARFWMLNNKGKFTLEFFKVGEEDYLPIENKLRIKEKIKDIIKPGKTKYKDAKGKYIPVPSKEKIITGIEDLQYNPVPSPTKSHLLMKTRENIIKHQRQGKLEKYIAFLPYIILVAAFVFLVIYYFKVAKELIQINQSAGKDCLKESEKVLKAIGQRCLGQPIVIEEENLPPNPMEEPPP